MENVVRVYPNVFALTRYKQVFVRCGLETEWYRTCATSPLGSAVAVLDRPGVVRRGGEERWGADGKPLHLRQL